MSEGSSATDLKEDGEVNTPAHGSSCVHASEQTLTGYENAESSAHGEHQPYYLTRRHDGGAVVNVGASATSGVEVGSDGGE